MSTRHIRAAEAFRPSDRQVEAFARYLRHDAVYERLSPSFYEWLASLIDGRVPQPAND